MLNKASAECFQLSIYGPSGGAGDGAVFNAERTVVTLHITDNGQYDDDQSDTVVRDPSGLGFTAPSSSSAGSSSGGGSGGSCFVATAAHEHKDLSFVSFQKFLMKSITGFLRESETLQIGDDRNPLH